MIKITREPLPEDLADRLAILTKKVTGTPPAEQAAEARMLWRRASTRASVHVPLGLILRQMAPGLEQCMYCGKDEGTDIDHFEPLARNPLRTFDWLNHLLACSTCNSHAKRDRFPVDASGQPLLIDPTAEDPFDHLLLTLTGGYYRPLSDKGATTIQVCDLNRSVLLEGRVRARTTVEVCLMMWHIASRDGDPVMMRNAVTAVREQPFADVCQAMLRQARMPGAELVFSESPHILAILRQDEVRVALLA